MLLELKSHEAKEILGVNFSNKRNKIMIYDVTCYLDKWMKTVSESYPNISMNYIEDLFYYAVESAFINYVTNHGYLDEHMMDIFVNNACEEIPIVDTELYDLLNSNAGLPSELFMDFSHTLPSSEDGVFMISRWEKINNLVRIHVVIYNNMISVEYESNLNTWGGLPDD